MISFLDESKGPFIGLNIRGRLTHEAYQSIVPTLEKEIKIHKKIYLLIDLQGFKGWNLRAAFDDTLFAIKNHKAIKRVAIICEKASDEWLTLIDQPFMRGSRGKAKYFLPHEKTQAWDWLKKINTTDTAMALPDDFHKALINRQKIAIIGDNPEALFFAHLLKQWAIPYSIFTPASTTLDPTPYCSQAVLPYLKLFRIEKKLTKKYPLLGSPIHPMMDAADLQKILKKNLQKSDWIPETLKTIKINKKQLQVETDVNTYKDYGLACVFEEMPNTLHGHHSAIIYLLKQKATKTEDYFLFLWQLFHEKLISYPKDRGIE